ncbi:MAG: zinc-ribbon domain-containing protein [Rickettsiales bacterium]|jgi:hypothetical protein|nr:zinc-ribbon domain-containing protein [Rickettsiales bacterium]
MKIICPVCNAEYAANLPNARAVKCACCGKVWTPPKKNGGSFLLIFASICALLAAAIFSATIVLKHHAGNISRNAPLTVKLEPVRQISDANGLGHWVVSGRISNRTDKIQGIPNFVIAMKNKDGDTIAVQKFLPPAPLLDAGESVEFKHTIAESVPEARKFGIEFEKADS